MTTKDCYLSVDIGGTKYIVGLVDRDGTILDAKYGTWDTLSQQCVHDTITAESEALLTRLNVVPRACGITIPGLADHINGIWVEAQNFCIRDYYICRDMENALHIPCYCDNDAQAYSLAEMLFGSCKGVADFFFMNVSTGIGGSIVSGGRLLYGSTRNAGEIGHWVIKENGRPCKCGSRGCLEQYASGPAIARIYEEAGGAPSEDGSRANAKEIAARARNGEALAIRVYQEEGRLLGSAVAKAVNLLNPAKVVLGGGVAMAFDLFGSEMKRVIHEQIYNAANENVEVLPTPLGYEAGLYGAAAIAISRMDRIFD